MGIRVYNPTTPGRRKSSVLETKHLSVATQKRLLKGASSTGGRSGGKISARHRGGGVKRLYRSIDFVQDKAVDAVVEQLEYDPFRTAFIALVKYVDGDRRYILAEASMQPGNAVKTGDEAPVRAGNRLPLRRIPSGTSVHNIQAAPHASSTYVRSAGSSAAVVSHEDTGYTQIKLPSGEVRRVLSNCLATVGVVSNSDHQNVRIGKAGRNRLKGRRPHVRGKAMNPVDHPHGGGEGGSPIGLKGPKTPSGLYTLGRKTRRRQRTKHIVRPRNSR